MMSFEEKNISKLLRLKRHEQPPAEYYNQFLENFQKRQREDLLKVPAWKLAWERISSFCESIHIPRPAYATALTAFLILAVGTPILRNNLINSGSEQAFVRAEAATASASPTAFASNIKLWDGLPELPQIKSHLVTAGHTESDQPRYVLDARPVSYEASYSF